MGVVGCGKEWRGARGGMMFVGKGRVVVRVGGGNDEDGLGDVWGGVENGHVRKRRWQRKRGMCRPMGRVCVGRLDVWSVAWDVCGCRGGML